MCLKLLGRVTSFYSLRLSGFVYVSNFLTMNNSVAQPAIMALKVIPKGKDKDMGEGKSEKAKAHCTLCNKKLFLDLAVEEKHTK